MEKAEHENVNMLQAVAHSNIDFVFVALIMTHSSNIIYVHIITLHVNSREDKCAHSETFPITDFSYIHLLTWICSSSRQLFSRHHQTYDLFNICSVGIGNTAQKSALITFILLKWFKHSSSNRHPCGYTLLQVYSVKLQMNIFPQQCCSDCSISVLGRGGALHTPFHNELDTFISTKCTCV